MGSKLIIHLGILFSIMIKLSLFGENDLAQLDHLIGVTKQNLNGQIVLREQLKTYLDLQTQYLKNPDDKELLLKAAKAASKALETIQDAHLAQTFSQSFMNELTLFAQISQKRGIPKP